MMSTALIEGLEIVAIVSLMTMTVAPILCWILPDRTAAVSSGASRRQVV